MIKFKTYSEDQTRALGARIGQRLKPGSVIGLDGSLGTGKTRLAQGIGLGLDVPPNSIVSPTYTICVPYDGRLTMIHIDAYRINDLSEVDELGLDELVDDGAVLVIEWASRIQAALPKIDIQIQIDTIDSDCRLIKLDSNDYTLEIFDGFDLGAAEHDET